MKTRENTVNVPIPGGRTKADGDARDNVRCRPCPRHFRVLRRGVRLPTGAGRRQPCAPVSASGVEAELLAAAAALESEAVRRALSGVEVPVFHQGRECGSTVKHSDQLLMFLLKALRPELFGTGREARQSAPGEAAGCGPVLLDIDLSAADDMGEMGETGAPGEEGERGEADEAGV